MLKRFVLEDSDAWTANTRATSHAAGELDPVPAPAIIPMGVDVDIFARGARDRLRRELRADEFLLLFVGRLVENKGCSDLLRAFSLLPADVGDKTVLWIVGDGHERSKLAHLAQELGIKSKARFWGNIEHRRLPDFYAAADLFVAPSVQTTSGEAEGQNLTVLEAAAARACVLATRVGGITEFVRDRATGVLVDPGNPPQLAQAIANLYLDAPLRVGLAENAAAEVKERYDWKEIAAQFERVYWQVLQTDRTSPRDCSD